MIIALFFPQPSLCSWQYNLGRGLGGSLGWKRSVLVDVDLEGLGFSYMGEGHPYGHCFGPWLMDLLHIIKNVYHGHLEAKPGFADRMAEDLQYRVHQGASGDLRMVASWPDLWSWHPDNQGHIVPLLSALAGTRLTQEDLPFLQALAHWEIPPDNLGQMVTALIGHALQGLAEYVLLSLHPGFTDLTGLLVRGVADVVITSSEVGSLIDEGEPPRILAPRETDCAAAAQELLAAIQSLAGERKEQTSWTE